MRGLIGIGKPFRIKQKMIGGKVIESLKKLGALSKEIAINLPKPKTNSFKLTTLFWQRSSH